MPLLCRCVRIHHGLGGNRTKSHTGYSLYNFGANRGIRLSPPVIFSLFSRIAVIHDGLRLGIPAGISCGPPGCLAGWMDRGASRPPSSPCPFVGHSVPNNGNRERHPDEITHSALLFSSRIGVERRSRNLHRIGASRASCDMAAWGIRHPGGSLQASRCAVERPCALLQPAPARHPQCRHVLHANHP